MKIDCQFMELGKPLFLAGVNYGDKLKEKGSKGWLKLFWDTEERRGEVHDSRGFFTYITESWIFTYEPKQELQLAVPINKTHDQVANVSAVAQVGAPYTTAQVTTPQQNVQRKAGRPPRYQGE